MTHLPQTPPVHGDLKPEGRALRAALRGQALQGAGSSLPGPQAPPAPSQPHTSAAALNTQCGRTLAHTKSAEAWLAGGTAEVAATHRAFLLRATPKAVPRAPLRCALDGEGACGVRERSCVDGFHRLFSIGSGPSLDRLSCRLWASLEGYRLTRDPSVDGILPYPPADPP